ncbi:hypothetical protein Pelo_7168 [Pelomyxa schiedti]|nr:hypothetical protein Pelo_7168 [Pelomyxa schiedti]
MKMLLCEVALGRSFEITTNLTTGSQYHDLVLPPPLPNSTQTTDSIWVPGRSDATSGLGVFTSECIIFHRYQALPRYVIHYVIS